MKKIKFTLPLKGLKIYTLEELQDNFSADILPIFQSGKLAKWFKSRDLLNEVAAIEAIAKDGSELQQLKAICQVLGLDDDEEVLQFLLEDRPAAATAAAAESPAAAVSEAESDDSTSPQSSGVDWSGKDLSGRSFTGENLRYANLRGCNFEAADLSSADMTGANLTAANLTHAKLIGANLSNAVLVDANLTTANLFKTNLSHADLSNADLSYTHKTSLDLSPLGLVASIVNIAGDFHDLNLHGSESIGGQNIRNSLNKITNKNVTASTNILYTEGANFSHANLAKANLTESKLSRSNFSSAKLRHAILINADFKNANFTNADLSFSDLKGAHFVDVNFTDCKLTGVTGFQDTRGLTAAIERLNSTNKTYEDKLTKEMNDKSIKNL